MPIVLSTTPMVNAAIARARSFPEFVASLPPALALQLQSKPLLASKTPWGTLAAYVVGWVSTRYGLGWDANLCSVVAGAAVLAGSYAMRSITTQPIAGLVRTPPDVALPPPGADAAPLSPVTTPVNP